MKPAYKYVAVCSFVLLCMMNLEGQNKSTLVTCAGKSRPETKLSPKQTKDAVEERTNFRVPLGARIEGCVYLELYINEKGIVECLTVISGPPPLATLVTDEVMTWKFKASGKRQSGTLVPCYKNGWTLGEEEQKKK